MARRSLRFAILGASLLATFGALASLVLHHGASPAMHAQTAQAAGSCSNATLNGSYGQLAQGYVLSAPDGTPLAAPVPDAIVNLVTADGAGNMSRTGTANLGGTVSPNPATGTYSVSSDCTLTIAFSRTPQAVTHVAGVLVDGGKKIYVVIAEPNPVNSATWEQLASSCSNASVNGSYGYSISGGLLVGPDGTPLASPMPFSAVGMAVTDGAGNISGSETDNAGGNVTNFTWSGTYSVNADCSGTETGTTSVSQTVHNALAVLSSGKVIFVGTDPGAVVSGTAEPQ